ncbi:copper resistance CopC family protein [Microbacterium hydrocarbonoxydans]|uniref:copper resistance CopC family protein n=1 Tax=Microbacterium hydrocarbonoxydans TaxID=273678 RepID=UPI0020C835D0|nr:copper resistance CopC family protein [Microbacterium hydrocarbonoxydans]
MLAILTGFSVLHTKRNNRPTDSTPCPPDERTHARDLHPPHRWLASTLLALIALGIVAAPAPAALAHDNLLDTVPGADETVTQLDDVALTFSGELIDFSQASFAQVQGPDGLFYESSCSTIDRNILTTPVALGEPGVYTVLWNAVSSDGHPISESFTFTYAPTGIEPGLGWDQPACGNEQSRMQPAKASPSAVANYRTSRSGHPCPGGIRRRERGGFDRDPAHHRRGCHRCRGDRHHRCRTASEKEQTQQGEPDIHTDPKA